LNIPRRAWNLPEEAPSEKERAMSDSTSFRIRENGVTHENIDGEVIAVDLTTGCYFSLTGVAAEVWTMLSTPAPVDGIAAALRARYPDCPADAERHVAAFLADLERRGLVSRTAETAISPRPAPAAEATPPGPYAPPGIEAFEDLKDLLELDPIHDVGEDGWPNAAGDGERTRRAA
jgi:hypothetical protein